jgi:hypothetical protein
VAEVGREPQQAGLHVHPGAVPVDEGAHRERVPEVMQSRFRAAVLSLEAGSAAELVSVNTDSALLAPRHNTAKATSAARPG